MQATEMTAEYIAAALADAKARRANSPGAIAEALEAAGRAKLDAKYDREADERLENITVPLSETIAELGGYFRVAADYRNPAR